MTDTYIISCLFITCGFLHFPFHPFGLISRGTHLYTFFRVHPLVMVFHGSILLPPPNSEYLFNLLRQDFE